MLCRAPVAKTHPRCSAKMQAPVARAHTGSLRNSCLPLFQVHSNEGSCLASASPVSTVDNSNVCRQRGLLKAEADSKSRQELSLITAQQPEATQYVPYQLQDCTLHAQVKPAFAMQEQGEKSHDCLMHGCTIMTANCVAAAVYEFLPWQQGSLHAAAEIQHHT